jgi:hypothetical protein
VKSLLAALALSAALASPAYANEPPAIASPDPTLTPGAMRTDKLGEICFEKTSQFRHWDPARSALIFESYHIAPADRMAYNLDHLLPLELGGADTVANIWPQPRRSLAGEWDDTRKDELEHRLHALVYSGQVDVDEAQKAIMDDWSAAYRKFVGEPQ